MPGTLLWIVGSGLAMGLVALVGSATLLLKPATLRRFVMLAVALAAGTLIGGALFHMIPSAIETMGNRPAVYVWIAAGFTSFLVLEQVLQWHHHHAGPAEPHRPLGWLILIADGVHNFVGGLAVGGAFMLDVEVGIVTWFAAAAHEVPQEIGDFGILLHSGWSRRRALVMNFLSALTFLVGGVFAWAASQEVDVAFLVPFAAGNFIYIAAADLIPELQHGASMRRRLLYMAAFSSGLLLLLALSLLLEH